LAGEAIGSAVTLLIIHYHLRPGGVRRVIELATPHLVAHWPEKIRRVALATGEAPGAGWLERFRAQLSGTPVTLFVEPAFGYASELPWTEPQLQRRVAEGVRRLRLDARQEECLIWAHNLGLGRNLRLACELTRYASVLPEVVQLPRPAQDDFLFRQIQTGRTVHLTPETAAMLRWLKERDCLLGIASNAQAYTLRELQATLAPHGLGMDLFERDLSVWSFEHGFSKPDPHVLQILTARLAARGIGPDETRMNTKKSAFGCPRIAVCRKYW
jgi:hypothetical protein